MPVVQLEGSGYCPQPVPNGHRRCPDCVRDLPFTEAYWKLYPASQRHRLKVTLCPTRCADCQREWWRRDSVKRKAEQARTRRLTARYLVDLLFMRQRARHPPSARQAALSQVHGGEAAEQCIDFPFHNGYATGLLTVCHDCTGCV